MKGQMFLRVQAAFSFVAGLVFIGAVGQGSAQITLQDGNSVALIDPSSQAGMYYWAVQNSPDTYQNQLNKQWFWYRLGNNPESSIDTLAISGISQPTPNHVIVNYLNPGQFTLSIDYNLVGGAASSGTADITEQIRIDNISGTTLPFHFFQYSDFNMAGDAANDFVLLSRNGFTFRFNQADQLDGANIVEVTTTPNANHAEADFVPNTFNKLNDGFPTVLDDSKTNAGPGDVAWAFEWDPNIGVGGSYIISKDKHLDVQFIPEPASFALLPLGLAAAAYYRRRRQS